MDEELREWKVHFNICDAAHLALRNILTRHVLPPGHSQSAALDEQSIQRESPQYLEATIGQEWPIATAQAGSLIFGPSPFGDAQLNNVEFHLPVYSAEQQSEDSVYRLNSGPDEENSSVATCSQDYYRFTPYDAVSNRVIDSALEDLSSRDSNEANQWKACFSQDQQFIPQPTCGSGDLDLLLSGTLQPGLSTNSQLRHDFHSTILPGETLSNYEDAEKLPCRKGPERAPRRKHGRSNPPCPRRLTKGTKRNVACARCWTLKKKCEDLDLICKECSRSKIPLQVCVRERFADAAVFSKWENKLYGLKLAWQHLSWEHSPKTVELQHHEGGPHMTVECRHFDTVSTDETSLYWKAREGWRVIETTPFGLENPLKNMDDYISQCALIYLRGDVSDLGYVGGLLKMVKTDLQDQIVRLTMDLWTASCLLMKGWTVTSEETLGMRKVEDIECPLHGSIPAPRVLQNQLDRNLECFIIAKEKQLLKAIQRELPKSRSEGLNVIFSSVIIILHVLEKDTWRLMYWKKRREERYKWRHPDKPETLIEKNIHLANLLLTHLRCAGELSGAMESFLSGQFNGKKHHRYDEGNESSLDGYFSVLLLEESRLASAEKLASFSSCT